MFFDDDINDIICTQSQQNNIIEQTNNIEQNNNEESSEITKLIEDNKHLLNGYIKFTKVVNVKINDKIIYFNLNKKNNTHRKNYIYQRNSDNYVFGIKDIIMENRGLYQ